MANNAKQNPRNKVGRYSGAGDAGISEIVPTEAESRRGLKPVRVGEPAGSGRLKTGLGLLALLGAGFAAFTTYRVRQQRTLRSRLTRMVGLD